MMNAANRRVKRFIEATAKFESPLTARDVSLLVAFAEWEDRRLDAGTSALDLSQMRFTPVKWTPEELKEIGAGLEGRVSRGVHLGDGSWHFVDPPAPAETPATEETWRDRPPLFS